MSNRHDEKSNSPFHTIVEIPRIQRNNILKAERKRYQEIVYEGNPIRIGINFLRKIHTYEMLKLYTFKLPKKVTANLDYDTQQNYLSVSREK